MNIKPIILCLAFLAMTSSCMTYRHSVAMSHYNTMSYTDDIYLNLEVKPENKITGTVKSVYLCDFICFDGFNKEYADIQQAGKPKGYEFLIGTRGQRMRSLALGEATKDTDYDVVVNPHYRTKRRNILFGVIKIYTISVTGYGAKISDITTKPHYYPY